MQALILTAGLGTRLRPHTLKHAKPTLPFLNVPMLGYSLFQLENLGLKKLILNTHHAAESVHACAEEIARPDYSVHFSHEPEILSSGGAVWKAMPLLDTQQPLFLMNGDNICLANDPLVLKRLLEFHSEHGGLATLLCCPHEEVGKSLGGVFVEKTQSEAGYEWGAVKQFSKTLVDGLKGYHYASALILSPEVYDKFPQGSSNLLYDVLTQYLSGEKVFCYVDHGLKWFETGDPRNYLEASRICLSLLNQNDSYSRYLEAILKRFNPGWDNYKQEGVFSNRPLPSHVHVKPGAYGLVGRGIQWGQQVHLKDFFVIGNSCLLGDHSVLEAGVLLPRTKLSAREKLFSGIKSQD